MKNSSSNNWVEYYTCKPAKERWKVSRKTGEKPVRHYVRESKENE